MVKTHQAEFLVGVRVSYMRCWDRKRGQKLKKWLDVFWAEGRGASVKYSATKAPRSHSSASTTHSRFHGHDGLRTGCLLWCELVLALPNSKPNRSLLKKGVEWSQENTIRSLFATTCSLDPRCRAINSVLALTRIQDLGQGSPGLDYTLGNHNSWFSKDVHICAWNVVDLCNFWGGGPVSALLLGPLSQKSSCTSDPRNHTKSIWPTWVVCTHLPNKLCSVLWVVVCRV